MSVQIICRKCRQAFHMHKVIGNLCIPCFRLIEAQISEDKALTEAAEDMVLGRSQST